MAIRYTHKEELLNSWSHAGGIVLLGPSGRMPLSFWYAGVVCCLYHLSCLAASQQVEGALAPLGPCCHLLAYRRQLLATDSGGIAHSGLLGLVAVLVCVVVRHHRNDHQFYQVKGTFQRRDVLFYRHGTLCARGLQTAS